MSLQQQRKNGADIFPFDPQVYDPNQMGFNLNSSPLDLEQKKVMNNNCWAFCSNGTETKWRETDGKMNDIEVKKRSHGHTKICGRGHWRPNEDAKLKELVAQNGPQNWNLIAEKLQGRSGKSCRLRWFNQLDPRINKKAFTEDEEERLLAAHKMYGTKWALIAKLFPGRTDNSVKNQWHVIMSRKQREEENNSFYRTRRRKKQQQQASSMAACTNLSSSNNVDESAAAAASTCTDLSLTPSSTANKVHPTAPFFTGGSASSSELHHFLGSSRIDHHHEEVMNLGIRVVQQGELLCRKGPIVVAKADAENNPFGHHYSDTKSEVSASSDSVANLYMNMDDKNSNRNLPLFIDFLGVGAF